MGQEGCTHQPVPKSLEGLDTPLIKEELLVHPGQPGERGCNPTVVLDEPPVEVAEAQERLDPADSPRVLPVCDHLYLIRIYLNPLCTNDEAQVLSPLDSELVLLDISL